MTGAANDIDVLREYITENRDALLRHADDPAELDRVLTGLETFWEQETDPAVRWSETWAALAKYPRVVGEIVGRSQAGARPAAAPVEPPAEKEDQKPPPDRRSPWGRDQVAGVLAVLIVLTALIILVISVFRVGDAERAVAKDALVFASGILGVVLGYYFGRAPGEARADQAEENAQQAQTELDRTLGEVQGIVESGTASTRGAAGVALAPDQVERLRAIAARRR